MGAGASIESGHSLKEFSAEEIAELISSLGDAYSQYSDAIIDNGVDGSTIFDLDDDKMIVTFGEIGINSTIHQKRILKELNSLKNENNRNAGNSSDNDNEEENHDADDGDYGGDDDDLASKLDKVIYTDVVTRTPKDIMTSLFKIQGIHLDPSDMKATAEKIAEFVGSDGCDGEDSFDCFINYRVATDKDIAEQLYYMLKSLDIQPFWDKMCLKNGMDWKQGFLSGLKRSRKFVALISVAGLGQIKNPAADHTKDNVLLEYETALKVMEAIKDQAYILPVLVGELNGNTLTKFGDFGPYPDSITPIVDDPPQE